MPVKIMPRRKPRLPTRLTKDVKLYACYDGKMGRAVPVRVLAIRGPFIQAEFIPYLGESLVRVWFFNGGAWVKHKDALMPRLGFIKGAESGGDWHSLRTDAEMRAAGIVGTWRKL